MDMSHMLWKPVRRLHPDGAITAATRNGIQPQEWESSCLGNGSDPDLPLWVVHCVFTVFSFSSENPVIKHAKEGDSWVMTYILQRGPGWQERKAYQEN